MGPRKSRLQALKLRAAAARGLTLIELVVVICAVALLYGVALDRLLRYQELAEKTALEQNVAAINVALTLKFGALVVRGRGAAIAQEVGRNPVDLLARPPEGYVGELAHAASVGDLQRSSWYFDRSSGELVYVPNRTRYLTEPPDAAQRGLRFRVALTEPRGARADGEPLPELRQPYLRPARPIRWVVE
jgi:general secretion pathway protein G